MAQVRKVLVFSTFVFLGSEKRKSPINEPPVVYAQVNKQRSRKKP